MKTEGTLRLPALLLAVATVSACAGNIGEYDAVMKVKKVRGTRNSDSTYSISVTLQLPARHYVGTTISDLQEYITDCIERYGGVMVRSVSIEIEEWG